jgi:hypothetical protein
LPDTTIGGHADAQPPEHFDLLEASASNRYSVRPRPSTRIFPSGAEADDTVREGRPVGEDPAVLVVADIDGEDPPPLFEHPPTTATHTVAVITATAGLLRLLIGCASDLSPRVRRVSRPIERRTAWRTTDTGHPRYLRATAASACARQAAGSSGPG